MISSSKSTSDTVGSASTHDHLKIDDLSPENQQRLADILDAYLIATEEGVAPSIDSLMKEHADLAPILGEYLEGLQLLRAKGGSDKGNDSWATSDGLAAVRNLSSHAGQLEDYELHEEIGRGAMGVVYAATQRSLGRRVAVKVLAFSSVLEPMRVERFVREARAAASLNHPNIVSVYAIGLDNGTHFYVMPLIEGASLDRVLQEAREHREANSGKSAESLSSLLSGPNRYRKIASLGAAAADALHVAHKEGIIHRDIKPSNLLLGKDGVVRVTDFGLARVQHNDELTRSGDLIGTFRYMSREQARGRNDQVDGRTDIYGLGATLYEIVTLQPPYAGEEGAALLRMIAERSPLAPRLVDRSIPRDLETIIQRAMRPERDDRYATAMDMRDDLQRFAEGKPILASRVSSVERMASWSREHVRLVLGMLAGAVLALCCAIAVALLLTDAKQRTESALDLARDNYQQLRGVVDTLGPGMAQRLASIPAADSVRRDMLAETLRHYESFVRSANQDPLLAIDVATTKLKIARIVLQVGTLQDADRSFQDALDTLGSLAQSDSSSAREAAIAYCFGMNEWAMAHAIQGDSKRATELLDEAASMLERAKLLAYGPAVALTENNRGVVLVQLGKFTEAERAIELAIAALQADSASSYEKEELLSLADAMNNLSVLMDQSGRADQARLLAEKSLELRTRGSIQELSDPQEVQSLAIAYSNMGAMRWKDKDIEGAWGDYQKGVELLEQALQSNPNNVFLRSELAIALNNLGMVTTSMGDATKAEKIFRRAASIAEGESNANGKNAEAASRVAGIWNNLGVLLRNQGRTSESERLFLSASEKQQIAVQLAPENRSYQTALQQIRQNLQPSDNHLDSRTTTGTSH